MDTEQPPEPSKGIPISWASLEALSHATFTDLSPFRSRPDGSLKARITRLLACPACSSYRVKVDGVEVAPVTPREGPTPLRKVTVSAPDARCEHSNGGPEAQPGIQLLCSCEEGHEFRLRFTLFEPTGSTMVELLHSSPPAEHQ